MAEQILWTSPDGGAIDLTDGAAGYSILANGTRGLRSVTYEISSSKYAGIDGESVDSIRAAANQPTLGVLLSADDEDEFLTRARGLVHAMRPKPGPGTLTVRQSDGSARALTCYCTEGMEGDAATDVTLPGSWWRMALKFYAPDPWWYGDSRTLSVGLGVGSNFFPIFPLALAPSNVQGQFTVDLSDADAPTYPVWTIAGPGSSLVLTNQTTGRVIQVDTTLGAGQTLIIDTRPGFQSVRLGDGTNVMGDVTSDPALWPLVEGVNVVTAVLTGATTVSRIDATYQPRYAGI